MCGFCLQRARAIRFPAVLSLLFLLLFYDFFIMSRNLPLFFLLLLRCLRLTILTLPTARLLFVLFVMLVLLLLLLLFCLRLLPHLLEPAQGVRGGCLTACRPSLKALLASRISRL